MPQQRSGDASRHILSPGTLTDQTRIPRPSLPRPTASVLLPSAVPNPSSVQPVRVQPQRCDPATSITSLDAAQAHSLLRSSTLGDESLSSRPSSLTESPRVDSLARIHSLSSSSQSSSTRSQVTSPSIMATPTVPLKCQTSDSEIFKIPKSAKRSYIGERTSDDNKTQECGKRTEQDLPPFLTEVQRDTIGDEILAVVRNNNSGNSDKAEKSSDAQRKGIHHNPASLSISATQANNKQHFHLGVALHFSDTKTARVATAMNAIPQLPPIPLSSEHRSLRNPPPLNRHRLRLRSATITYCCPTL